MVFGRNKCDVNKKKTWFSQNSNWASRFLNRYTTHTFECLKNYDRRKPNNSNSMNRPIKCERIFILLNTS